MEHQWQRESLSHASEVEFEALLALTTTMTHEDLTRPGVGGGAWSAKDTLAHVTWWQRHMLGLLDGGEETITALPGEGDDAVLDRVNAQAFAEHRDQPLDQVLRDLRASHTRVLARIRVLSEAEFAEHAAWIASNACEHYAEHRAAIEAWRDAGMPATANG